MTGWWQLFRYRSVNDFLWQELELARFYCCSPLVLNDPFDCRIDWSASLERALASPNMTDARRKQLSNIRKKFSEADPPSAAGVCCFTCKANDPLMWSHYADSHRGVCLQYEIPDDYFMKMYSPEADKDFFFVGGAPVNYRSTFYDWLVTGDLDSPHAGCVGENALTVLFTVKAQEWCYEEEYRIITRRPGKMAFESGFLRKIIFGLDAPAHHRELLAKVAKRTNKHIVVSRAQRRLDSDFGIVLVDATD